MMYTEGIRKIFTCTDIKKTKLQIAGIAEHAGFKAFSFNGEIWCRNNNDWIQTCFQITDFQDVQT